jgi:hypothetical protein
MPSLFTKSTSARAGSPWRAVADGQTRTVTDVFVRRRGPFGCKGAACGPCNPRCFQGGVCRAARCTRRSGNCHCRRCSRHPGAPAPLRPFAAEHKKSRPAARTGRWPFLFDRRTPPRVPTGLISHTACQRSRTTAPTLKTQQAPPSRSSWPLPQTTAAPNFQLLIADVVTIAPPPNPNRHTACKRHSAPAPSPPPSPLPSSPPSSRQPASPTNNKPAGPSPGKRQAPRPKHSWPRQPPSTRPRRPPPAPGPGCGMGALRWRRPGWSGRRCPTPRAPAPARPCPAWRRPWRAWGWE